MNADTIRLGAAVVLVFSTVAGAAEPARITTTPADPETPEQHDARMKWWREARFGMFIHWGLYAVPAGTWKGKRIPGIGEWIMNRAKIPVDEYAALAKQFNPVKFDADEWVRIAKDAGMKYIVITSKHHDGFAMFRSRTSPYNIYDATPFKRDPIAELKAACVRQGIRLGLYYSQAQDWHHPGGAAAGGHWDPKQDGDMDQYIRTIAAPQVREILTRYQPAIIWWDTAVNMTKARADMLLPLVRLRPGIIMNNRLGGGYRGDYSTPEQHIPPTGLNYDWETCMTMNGTWGYKSYDNNWKSTETLIRNLVDIASKGGNYLLNVGPTAEGVFPRPSIERLAEIGRWMRVNGESIYRTRASIFTRPFAWGRVTTRQDGKSAVLYLHVFDWPASRELPLPGLTNKVLEVALLAAPTAKTAFAQNETGVVLHLPPEAPDPIDSVVKLTVAGKLNVVLVPLKARKDGSFRLHAAQALVHGKNLRYEKNPRRGLDNLGFWTDPNDWAEWPIAVRRPGQYEVEFTVATPGKDVEVLISAGDRTLAATVARTGAYNKFEKQKMGRLKVPAGGAVRLSVRCGKHWTPINLRAVALKPVTE
ncbi:MAG: glycosyl hydrolase [Kiritimatiellaeota bacterium]|nr:glycosyl hydrolase [Kiritimatiellota bacterium]